MNNESPLIPKGSLLEQKNKGRMRFKIAVFVVLGLHGVAVMALLMQGCKDRNAESTQTTSTPSASESRPDLTTTQPSLPTPSLDSTNPVAPENTTTGTVPATAAAPAAPLTTPTGVGSTTVPTVINPVPAAPVTGAEIPPAGGVGDYKVAKGDTFAKIAKQAHVSLPALMAANPGVEAKKLKIGQTLHLPASATPAGATLPAGTPGALTAPGTSPAPNESAGSEQVWVVKSGDSLIKIAGQFGVKVKALRAANNLKTDKIHVGQKLKIPAKPQGSTTAATAAVPAVSSTPAPVTGAGPTGSIPSAPASPAGR